MKEIRKCKRLVPTNKLILIKQMLVKLCKGKGWLKQRLSRYRLYRYRLYRYRLSREERMCSAAPLKPSELRLRQLRHWAGKPWHHNNLNNVLHRNQTPPTFWQSINSPWSQLITVTYECWHESLCCVCVSLGVVIRLMVTQTSQWSPGLVKRLQKPLSIETRQNVIKFETEE